MVTAFARKPKKPELDVDELLRNAQAASEFLKALSHEARLVILCLLTEGEKSVTEIEQLLKLRQPAVSQQLARLRADDLVETRRDGKNIYYSLARPEVRQVIEALHAAFCAPDGRAEASTRSCPAGAMHVRRSSPESAAARPRARRPAFGFVARRGRFCTLGAIEDSVYSDDTRRLRTWLLAIGVAIVGVHLLEVFRRTRSRPSRSIPVRGWNSAR